jgi:hypothetical protein
MEAEPQVVQAQRVLLQVPRVLSQIRRHTLEGTTVPCGEKVLSLFQPHTKAVPRHTGGQRMGFVDHRPGLVAADTKQLLREQGVQYVAIPVSETFSEACHAPVHPCRGVGSVRALRTGL